MSPQAGMLREIAMVLALFFIGEAVVTLTTKPLGPAA
jgi:hypothetical protein